MYSAPYGYGNAAGQPFSGPATGPTPQMQPGPGPNQPQQQMMYNQQYPMGPGGAFSGAANPGAMMSGPAGPAGMMQNTAMPQMAANGQSEHTLSPFSTSHNRWSHRSHCWTLVPLPLFSHFVSGFRVASFAGHGTAVHPHFINLTTGRASAAIVSGRFLVLTGDQADRIHSGLPSSLHELAVWAPRTVHGSSTGPV